jgi:hypothetical protein
MENFKPLEAHLHTCYTVTNLRWDCEKQAYVRPKLVVFDNEDDARRCFDILEEYKNMCSHTISIRNVMAKDTLVYDGTTLHLMSGCKVDHNEYADIKASILAIEQSWSERSWGRMDAYARLFEYKPRRPRSFLGSLLYCCCCFCICTDDVCTYTV